jgi:DNA adenine methylase
MDERSLLPQARPFLKWAGGKTQLLEVLRARVTSGWDPRRDQYVEPFLGGGALYFALRPRRALLGDMNSDLVACWRMVRDRVADLTHELLALQGRYRLLPLETFLDVRSWDPSTLDDVRRAARMIFLNKTCFNGLYRVNQSGIFNVGWCKNPRAGIVDVENLTRCSELMLSGEVDVECSDFEAPRAIAPGALVYLDPPYLPSTTSGYVRYTAKKFTREDCERLVAYASHLVEDVGCHVIASQSGDEGVVDLYRQRGFTCERVDAVRMINSKGSGRGAVLEHVISRSPKGPRRS